MNIQQASTTPQASVGELPLAPGIASLGAQALPQAGPAYPLGCGHVDDDIPKCETSCSDLQVLADCSVDSGLYYPTSASHQHQLQQTTFYQDSYYQQDYVFNYYEQESSRGYTPSSEYAYPNSDPTATVSSNAAIPNDESYCAQQPQQQQHRLPTSVASDEFRFVSSGETDYFDAQLDGHPTATSPEDLPISYQQSDLSSYDNMSLYATPSTNFVVERSNAAPSEMPFSNSGGCPLTPMNSEGSDSSFHPIDPVVVPGVCLATNGGVCSNSCTICGRFCARSSTLKTHLRVHSGERPYACRQCLKRFSQAANLTAHMRIHSGEKPFLCPVCHRKFSQSSSVTTHMRTHSGERPYACSLCKKRFSDSSTLTKHFRTHSGERPYQCRACFMRFSQSGNLNRHMKIHGQKGT